MEVFCKFLLLAVLAGAVTAQWGPNVVDTNTGKVNYLQDTRKNDFYREFLCSRLLGSSQTQLG